MILIPLPSKVQELLDQLQAPPRLVANLTLVHDVAFTLVSKIDGEWPNLEYDRTAVLIGAATHDITATSDERLQWQSQHSADKSEKD